MPLNALHHITVQTDDLEATRDFYRDVLGLRVGFRPDLDFPGYWLYCGEVPVVHLVPRGNAIGGGPSSDTGPFDHFAFLASDFQGVK
jgi:catechol 2,3-dioxygenase-like lactoylglutathione lyase family enzyme